MPIWLGISSVPQSADSSPNYGMPACSLTHRCCSVASVRLPGCGLGSSSATDVDLKATAGCGASTLQPPQQFRNLRRRPKTATRGCKDAAGVKRWSYTTQPRYAGRFYLSDDRREFGGSLGGARLTGFYPGAARGGSDDVSATVPNLRHVAVLPSGAPPLHSATTHTQEGASATWRRWKMAADGIRPTCAPALVAPARRIPMASAPRRRHSAFVEGFGKCHSGGSIRFSAPLARSAIGAAATPTIMPVAIISVSAVAVPRVARAGSCSGCGGNTSRDGGISPGYAPTGGRSWPDGRGENYCPDCD
jgi:hypothetical protein